MKYHPDRHHRRSIRLPSHDYTASGLYFITICTHDRECLFGEIADGEMQLNSNGEIVVQEWLKSPSIRTEIILDAWVVMPNHFHGIVSINPIPQPNNIIPIDHAKPDTVGVNGRSPSPQISSKNINLSPKSLSSFVAGFKSSVTKQINLLRETPRIPVWQRNYYEHIIRNHQALLNIRHYIENNPLNWVSDQLHPDNLDMPKIPKHHAPQNISP